MSKFIIGKDRNQTEFFLFKKATELKKDGNIDSAIETLKLA